jgi:hypothetical protein
MNTKTLLLTGVVAIMILLMGERFVATYMHGKTDTPNGSNTAVQVDSTGVPKETFNAVKDLMAKSMSLECTFTDTTGRDTRTFIKNGSIRADFTGKQPQQTGSMIIRNKEMFLWTANKKGFTVMLTDAELNGNPTEPGQAATQNPLGQQNFLGTLERYKDSCKTASISDDIFQPPADIAFSDFAQFMHTIAPSIGTQGLSPTTTGAPASKDQIKVMIKQYVPAGATVETP